MRGLALEGGGARGAYHMGVVKAYMEHGYEFDGFVGTSIGAINAAVLAQGDFEKALELWEKISMEQIFDPEESHLITLGDVKLNRDLPSNLGRSIKKVINGRGIDTSKMKAFLEQYIDEDKIRQSEKDFGLVTFSLDERKPYEVFLEDIPKGKLINFIMASASVPGFRSTVIEEKKFIDGFVYNNCPINLLVEKGYDEIIAVRTGAFGVFRKVDKSANVRIISTEEDLGDLLSFSPENSVANIKLGYYDGLRSIKNLRGRQYYLNGVNLETISREVMALDDERIQEIGKILDTSEIPTKRLLFEQIIPQLGDYLDLKKDFDYADFVVALLEYSASQKKIERFKEYDYEEFYTWVKETPVPIKDGSLLGKFFQSKKEKAVEAFIKVLMERPG